MVRVRAWLGLGLVLASQASYATMLQVYDDYYVLTAIYHIGSFSHHALMHLVLVFPLGLYLPIHLYNLAILICRLVDLSTCRPSALVNKKDLVRVRVKLG